MAQGIAIDSLADRVKSIHESQLVPGLLFRVGSDKLKQHLTDRAAYHKRRAEEKQAEIPGMEDAVKSLEGMIQKVKGFDAEKAVVPPSFGKGTSAARAAYEFDGSPQLAQLEQQINALRADIKEHGNKAASFGFLAECLFDVRGGYALDWSELRQLELVK